ncbi:hypothetical protein GE09DRAFT_1088787 [Coniochaeta sp. 2T2.1]|nr:hypothetical protein GE09DRAFT_1088787 [Coniochaeta sp. 2T2.1]
MARMDAEQSRFMASYRDRVIAKAETFSQINHSDRYDSMYWYTTQLFEPDWKPRDSLEHAPNAGW